MDRLEIRTRSVNPPSAASLLDSELLIAVLRVSSEVGQSVSVQPREVTQSPEIGLDPADRRKPLAEVRGESAPSRESPPDRIGHRVFLGPWTAAGSSTTNSSLQARTS